LGLLDPASERKFLCNLTNVLLGQQNGGDTPLTYQAFCKIIGKPPPPLDAPSQIPSPPEDLNDVEVVPVPTLEELGYINLDEVSADFLSWSAASSTVVFSFSYSAWEKWSLKLYPIMSSSAEFLLI
jgi:hypothetical protein